MFDAIRPYMPDQRFTKPLIDKVDELADLAGMKRLAGEYSWLPIALSLIKQFEGCRLTAYPDPGTGADPWTIGWGATGPGIRKGVTWTQDEADARLAKDVERFADGVTKAIGDARTTDAQKAAMISMAYNVGVSAFAGSTLLRKHKAGDYSGAADEFEKWNRAAGKVLAGLTRRRQAEAAMYRGLAA
jgi:lysozyme